MFENVLNSSMLLKAQKVGAVSFQLINLRDFGLGPRKNVDAKPYGGGSGMLLMVEPLYKAITKLKKLSPGAKVILLSPKGTTYLQSDAKYLASDKTDLILLCPRYEGYDERIIHWVDHIYSIGNYIVTGGELPAMVILDSITRLLPNVLGGEQSAIDESFQDDDSTMEYPQYTRPKNFKNIKVPKVLLSGNHQVIRTWKDTLKVKKNLN